MHYSPPFYTPNNYFRAGQMAKSYKALEEAIENEREDELFYDYLLSLAPTKEEKDIITSIRDDERKHYKYFKEIYSYYTRKSSLLPNYITFERPQSYIAGVRKAKFGELGAVERYRDIMASLPDRYYRDMVFEIITDELKHAHKYDYIIYLSLENKYATDRTNLGTTRLTQGNLCRQSREFTLDELAQYDGSMGRPAYVAVNGIVYDVSNEATWGGASHFGLMAGMDLSQQFQGCHGRESILAKLPRVGILKAQ